MYMHTILCTIVHLLSFSSALGIRDLKYCFIIHINIYMVNYSKQYICMYVFYIKSEPEAHSLHKQVDFPILYEYMNMDSLCTKKTR